MRYYLHSFGCLGVSLVGLAIGLGLFFLISDVVNSEDLLHNIIVAVVAIAPVFLLEELYKRVFRLSCPRCRRDLELKPEDDERFGWYIYNCKFCGYSHDTLIPHPPRGPYD